MVASKGGLTLDRIERMTIRDRLTFLSAFNMIYKLPDKDATEDSE